MHAKEAIMHIFSRRVMHGEKTQTRLHILKSGPNAALFINRPRRFEGVPRRVHKDSSPPPPPPPPTTTTTTTKRHRTREGEGGPLLCIQTAPGGWLGVRRSGQHIARHSSPSFRQGRFRFLPCMTVAFDSFLTAGAELDLHGAPRGPR